LIVFYNVVADRFYEIGPIGLDIEVISLANFFDPIGFWKCGWQRERVAVSAESLDARNRFH